MPAEIESRVTEPQKVLLVAFHFPPVGFSSGLQRVLSLVRQLPRLQWQPLVLSAHPRAYDETNDGQLDDVPPGTVITRAFALDTRRHLSIRGRYFYFMALPDQWFSWCIGGVLSGLRMILKHRPVVIWSTYPIASAHLIGLVLHKLTGLPWVADFRDSMTEPHYPSEPSKRKIFRWIESCTVHACGRAVFTTPGAIDMYRARYPDIPPERWVLIPNGYDEVIFDEVEKSLSAPQGDNQAGRKVLLHSGLVYPAERNPSCLFQALKNLKQNGVIDSERLVVKFRACGHENRLRAMVAEYGVGDIVELLPGIPYRDALAETMTADALLILQASSCNHQVPAKVYEYFRARRPVLALTDSRGDTARVLKAGGLTDIVPLDDATAIERELPPFLDRVERGSAPCASPEAVTNASRWHSTKLVSRIFDELTGGGKAG